MKYIHSIWDTNGIESLSAYPIRNFNSYLLSALLIKKLGYEIELFCNELTYGLYSLIPYDKIHVIDYTEDGIDSQFWVWSKLRAQSLMNEPYAHIDGDVFMFRDIIGDKLDTGKYGVVIQSVEDKYTNALTFNDVYINTPNPYLKRNDEYGIDWDKFGKNAYNCGVVGFSDLKLRDGYVNQVKRMLFDLSYDTEYLKHPHWSSIILAEQCYLYYYLESNGIQPFEVIPYDAIREQGIVWYDKLPQKYGYTHMLSISKYKPEIIKAIKNKIMKFFPEYVSLVQYVENKYNV